VNRGLAAVVALVVLALAPDASAGLVARYDIDSLPADGSVADSSGNSLNGGARLGDAIADGRFGGAIRLAGGVGTGFNVTNSPLLEPRRLTVATWARKGGPFNVFRTVVGKGGVGCSSSTWALYTAANGGLSFYVNTRDANGQQAPLQTPPIPPEQIWNNQWRAIAGTFDGTEVALWVDGVKVASAEYPGRPVYELDYARQVSEKRLQIGRYDEAGCSAAGFQFFGDLDEVRLYDRALSNTELATLQNPAATEPPVIPDPLPGTTPPGTTLPPSAAPPAAPPIAAPAAVAITQIASLPPAKACASRRKFPIRLRGVKANKIVRAQIKLNGKQVRNITGRALGLPIDLRGLPKGKFNVEIITTDSAGKRLIGKRAYRTCVAKRR